MSPTPTPPAPTHRPCADEINQAIRQLAKQHRYTWPRPARDQLIALYRAWFQAKDH